MLTSNPSPSSIDREEVTEAVKAAVGICPCPLARSSCAKLECQTLCCAGPVYKMGNVTSLALALAGEGGAAKEGSGGRGEGTREVNSTSQQGVDQHSTHRELPKVLSLGMSIISLALEWLHTECDLHPSLSGPHQPLLCVHRPEPAPDGLSSSSGSSRVTLSTSLPGICPAAWDLWWVFLKEEEKR